MSVYVCHSLFLIPCFLSFVHFSLLVTFLIYFSTFVNLFMFVYVLYHVVIFRVSVTCPFSVFTVLSSVLFS